LVAWLVGLSASQSVSQPVSQWTEFMWLGVETIDGAILKTASKLSIPQNVLSREIKFFRFS
jgi:hypothetical protein